MVTFRQMLKRILFKINRRLAKHSQIAELKIMLWMTLVSGVPKLSILQNQGLTLAMHIFKIEITFTISELSYVKNKVCCTFGYIHGWEEIILRFMRKISQLGLFKFRVTYQVLNCSRVRAPSPCHYHDTRGERLSCSKDEVQRFRIPYGKHLRKPQLNTLIFIQLILRSEASKALNMNIVFMSLPDCFFSVTLILFRAK